MKRSYIVFHSLKRERILPARFLFKRLSLLIVVFFIFGSFNFGRAYNVSDGYVEEDILNSSLEEAGFIMDSDGYLTKVVNAQMSGDRNWKGITGTHTVQPGETLSEIATSYGLKPSTIIWENNLQNSDRLSIGQKLAILPEDGVTVSVKKGENLSKISDKYKIDVKKVAESNNLSGSDAVIQVGDKIFIPGGRKIYEEPTKIAQAPSNSGKPSATRYQGTVEKVNVKPASNKKLVFPTTGQLTQGYSSGHYALDISDTSMPPVWAAADGVVVRAEDSGWNGGYGKMVVIDHGDGLETLYAHCSEIYVENGQYVSQGQVICKQGNTGRTYGRTGIHLHFEVHDNGVKRNPYNYY